MSLIETRHAGGWLELRLHRPDKRNAMDKELIAELSAALEKAASDEGLRCLLLSASGKAFCAGADLSYMREAATFGREQNVADAERLGRLFELMATVPFPTVAKIQGAALGGGGGLAACCDIPICGESAFFGFTEVRLGLIPAVISPYVMARIGRSHALRYFQTAEIIPGERAAAIGLVSEVVPDELLDEHCAGIIEQILSVAPSATRAARRLVDFVATHRGPGLQTATAERIADLRGGDEAKEGMSAFFEKRAPKWRSEAK